MRVKEGDLFRHPNYDYDVVCLSDKTDSARGKDYGFFGGSKRGKYFPVFFVLRLSRIIKANGWKRLKP